MQTFLRLAFSLRRVAAAALFVTFAIAAAPAPGFAQGHRALLSTDVSERIRQRVEAPAEFIVRRKTSTARRALWRPRRTFMAAVLGGDRGRSRAQSGP